MIWPTKYHKAYSNEVELILQVYFQAHSPFGFERSLFWLSTERKESVLGNFFTSTVCLKYKTPSKHYKICLDR